jgi:hypothetical protein
MQAFYAATLHSHGVSRLDQIPSSYSEDLSVGTPVMGKKKPSMDVAVIFYTPTIYLQQTPNECKSYSAEVYIPVYDL